MKSSTVLSCGGLGVLHSSGLLEARIGVINGREKLSSKIDEV
ncbi:MAG: hypothetical protein AAF378_18670 [Cyanobacteria bacterium P01_A01_bin.84]